MMPAACRWNVPDGGFYVWLTPAAGDRRQGDAAPRGHRAGRLRARHRVLRRRVRLRRDAAVLLLPHAGADPGGRTPARRRHRGRDGAARDLRRRRPGPRARLPRATTARAPTCPDRWADSPCATSPTRRSSSRPRPASGSSASDSASSAPSTCRAPAACCWPATTSATSTSSTAAWPPTPRAARSGSWPSASSSTTRLTGPLMRSHAPHRGRPGRGPGVVRHRGGVPAGRRGGRHLPRGHDLPGAWSSRSSRPARSGSRPQAGVPLVPVIMWGTQRMMTKDHPRDFSRGKTILLRVGEPLHPTGDGPGGRDRRAAPGDVGDARRGDPGLPGRRAAARVVVAPEAVRRQRADPRGGRRAWTPRRRPSGPPEGPVDLATNR